MAAPAAPMPPPMMFYCFVLFHLDTNRSYTRTHLEVQKSFAAEALNTERHIKTTLLCPTHSLQSTELIHEDTESQIDNKAQCKKPQ